ncbi:MAG: hypothetical protein LC790_02515 [Actinobacteria bacterium]|nr:hypothetical protein [Actinomycetota bacterium]
MSPARQADPELDRLIAEITIDAYDEDEALQAFENAFDEDAHFPLPATVIGEQIDVLSIGQANGRRELIATCTRDGHRYDIALIDIAIHADPNVSRLLAAYHRWLGP